MAQFDAKGSEYVDAESKLSKASGKGKKSASDEKIKAFLEEATEDDLKMLSTYIRLDLNTCGNLQTGMFKTLVKGLKEKYPQTLGRTNLALPALSEKLQLCWGSIHQQQNIEVSVHESDAIPPERMTKEGYEKDGFIADQEQEEEYIGYIVPATPIASSSVVIQESKQSRMKRLNQEKEALQRQIDDAKVQVAVKMREWQDKPRKIRKMEVTQTPTKKAPLFPQPKSQPSRPNVVPAPSASKSQVIDMAAIMRTIKEQSQTIKKLTQKVELNQQAGIPAPSILARPIDANSQCADCTILINQVLNAYKTELESVVKTGTNFVNQKSTPKYGTKLCKGCNHKLVQAFADLVKTYLKKGKDDQSTTIGFLLSRLPAYFAQRGFSAQDLANKQLFVLQKLNEFLALRIYYPVDKNTTIWGGSITLKQHLILSRDTMEWRLPTGVFGACNGLEAPQVLLALGKTNSLMTMFLKDFMDILNTIFVPDFSFSQKRKIIASPIVFDI